LAIRALRFDARKTFRALILLLAACGPVAAPPAMKASPPPALPARNQAPELSDDAAIAKAGQDYLDLLVEIHPEEATALGLHANDALLDDRSLAGEAAANRRQEQFLEALEAKFAKSNATIGAKTDLALLTGTLRCRLARAKAEEPLVRKPDVYVEPLNAIFQMTARDYAPAADRARNVVARLEKIPSIVAEAKVNLGSPPRVWTEVGIDQAASAKAFLDQQRPFLVAALPDEVARVDAALKAATSAYQDYRRFLQKEILPRSNGRFAAGRELFEFLLHNDYFLEMNADELLALGKKVFAETKAQMNAVAKRIDKSAKNWPEVTAKLKAKHPRSAELLDAYKKEVERARAFLVEKDAVPFPPGDDLEVIDTPTFLRSTLTAAYDEPPPFDAESAKGFFFVTPVDPSLSKAKQEEMLRENDWADIVDTTVHEAYPGHHLQLSFARLNPSRIRRAFDRAVLTEGWALYSEELMAELGYYDDEQRLIQLEWALVRAARIILDVGLHVGEMTFEQAVNFLTDDVHLERMLAVSEVKRYTESPTQPSAYMVGRELILQLRDRAKKRDGARFSLKAFHSDFLSRGTVPPSLLAKEMFADDSKGAAQTDGAESNLRR
jgi:uncharacterized protein (DUF885 family)